TCALPICGSEIVIRASRTGGIHFGDAWRKIGKPHHVASVEREVVDKFPIHYLPAHRILGAQQSSSRRDGHSYHRAQNRHSEIRAYVLTYIDLNSGPSLIFEPGCFHREVVQTGGHRAKKIAPLVVGFCGESETLLRIHECDVSLCDQGAGLVADQAGNRSSVELG